MPREKQSPCHKCEKRRELCHAICADYAAWRNDHALNKANREAIKHAQNDANAVTIDRIRKIKKAIRKSRHEK